ncbi:hypothetical protein GQX73_g10639 [Xylaria multiplex]|uniref:Sodium/calcium exchanger membrane region domain-containing protein n=1 Tax=Xylaria multiplex TaxID=323545 RepID=A0A7C8IGA9_9PEZI|nr:hypothetical protein GQX73_g10639 [Xylaria multiplex]
MVADWDAGAAAQPGRFSAALSDTDETVSTQGTGHTLAGHSEYHPFVQPQRLRRAAGDATRYRNTFLNFISKQSLKFVCFSSYLDYLMIFVPLGILTYYFESSHSLIFATNAIAIVPLSNVLAHATECLAADLGDAVGALMNISFGNLVEIIMFFAALRHNHIRVVKSALVGSILVNLLLILGSSIIAAEFQPADLVYDMNNAQALACLLSLSVFSILIPMAFHFTFKHADERENAVRALSRASAIILLIVYFVYLAFLLVPRRPTAVLADEETHISPQQEEQRSQPFSRTMKFADARSSRPLSRSARQENIDGNLWEYPEDSTFQGNRRRSSSQPLGHDNVQRWMKGASGPSRPRPFTRHTPSLSQSSFSTTRSLRANSIVERYSDGGGQAYPSPQRGYVPNARPYSSFHIVEPDNEIIMESTPKVSRTAAIVALTASTFFTAICAELLVDTIEVVIKSSGLTQSFIGLIILSVVGNAAEYITGVRVAARGKLDLAIGVSFGSSIQIALFVSPLTVIGGWFMGKNMTLYMGVFETAALVGAAILVNFLMANGKTNYLEGTLLCACYFITGIGSFLIP